jgi:hypothetical protein
MIQHVKAPARDVRNVADSDDCRILTLVSPTNISLTKRPQPMFVPHEKNQWGRVGVRTVTISHFWQPRASLTAAMGLHHV